MLLEAIGEDEAQPVCPKCFQPFTRKRKNQVYCGRDCQNKASRNDARGTRHRENRERTEGHYARAAWLSYDLNRMSPRQQDNALQAILEAASGTDAALRNILLDPALLGADPRSSVGKLYPDIADPSRLSPAKMTNTFCQRQYGCAVRDAILDDGKPAGRKFIGDPVADLETDLGRPPMPSGPVSVSRWHPPSLRRQAMAKLYAGLGLIGSEEDDEQGAFDRRPPARKAQQVPSPPRDHERRTYDWRRLARAMGDRGWRRFFPQDELDLML